MNHTAGPWYRMMQIPGGECLICAETPKGRVEIATVHREAENGGLPVEENSKLILSAPDLLVALKIIISRPGVIAYLKDFYIMDLIWAQEAVDKAEGVIA